MWDERSFSQSSFDVRSWLFGALAAVKRYGIFLSSVIKKQLNIVSKL